MSDISNIDARDLYQLMLNAFPTTGKNPQSRMKDRNAYSDQITQMLGFNPLTYSPSELIPYTEKPSAVRLQYGNDPVVAATLDNIDNGDSSASVASKLIDPDTGGLTEDAKNAGITMAQAQASVDAAKEYEKEKANSAVDKQLYESRQQQDPTFGRTKSNAPNANLPSGGFDPVTPQFTYSQDLLNQISALPNTPTDENYTSSIGGTPFVPGKATYVSDLSRRPTGFEPVMSDPNDPHATTMRATFGNPLTWQQMPQEGSPAISIRHTKQGTGPSVQDRAATQLMSLQKFVQNTMNAGPKVQSPANAAAVQRLLQIQQALGG